MIKIVEQYILEHELFNRADGILVGVSGGPDSIVLLDVLIKLGYKCEIAHVNFKLRGEASDVEMAFVKNIAIAYNISFHAKEVDTMLFAKENGVSIEMAAREIRYNFFEQLLRSENLMAIAIGHHCDDVAETMLINLVRGTGLRGLSGIASKNGSIVRPLLAVSRKDILEYANAHKLEFCTDASNMDTDIIRNKFRHIIIPALGSINPKVIQTLLKTANIAKETQKIVDYAVNQWIVANKTIDGNRILFNRNTIFEFSSPKTLLFEIISTYNFSSEVVDQLYEALKHQPGKQFYSPSHRIITGNSRLIIVENRQNNEAEYIIECIDDLSNLPIPINIAQKTISDFASEPKSKSIAYFDAQKVIFPLTLRKWAKGDWFVPFGQKGRKKLSDFFIDQKISIDEKERSWLLCSKGNIIWIVGKRSDNRFSIDENTRDYIKMECCI